MFLKHWYTKIRYQTQYQEVKNERNRSILSCFQVKSAKNLKFKIKNK